MEISSSSNIVTIKGNIKSLTHYEELKREIDNIITNSSNVKIKILESISITSSIIGYLCKLVDEGVDVELHVHNEGLKNLLDDLNLISLLNVRKA
ncbi:hypothetical protein [Sulfurimonas sp.]